MTLRAFIPRPHLAGRVAALWIAENEAGDAPVLPIPAAVMGIQYRGHILAEQGALSQAGVTGIQSHARRYTHPVATGTVLVRFTAQGDACLGVPASELVDRSVSLDDLLGRARSAELCERLCEARHDQARVLVVEEFLASLPFVGDALVSRAADLLGGPRSVSVAEVAVQLGVSERQLERRFRSRTGMSPKQFARLARFERTVGLSKTGPVGSLASLAQRAGYYDQAHFSREVRNFTGGPPGDLFFSQR